MARLVKVLMAGVRTGDVPVSSGLVYAYDTGTTTPGTYLYSDNALSSAHANPATLDSDGRLEAYCSDTANFRLVVKNAAGTTTIIDVDPAEGNVATLTNQITVDTTNDDSLTAGAGSLLSAWMGFIWASLNGSSTAGTAKDLKYLHTGTGAVGRTIRARFSDRFNVIDFGATGDGTTDDRAAIQRAIDAAADAGGGVVSIPGNTYVCGTPLTITDQDGVSIIGDGLGSILKASFSNDSLIKITGTSDSIEIASLQLQGGGNAGTASHNGINVASGIPATGRLPVSIHDVMFTGPSDGTGFYTCVYASGDYVSVSNCFMQRVYGAGAVVFLGSYCSANDNTIKGADGAGTKVAAGVVAGDWSRIAGNTITGCSSAGIEIPSGADDASVGENSISACVYGVRVVQGLRAKVSSNLLNSNNYGVYITDSGSIATYGFSVAGNAIHSSVVNGIRVLGGSDGASYLPRGGNISGNSICMSTQSGVYLAGCNMVAVSGNSVYACSTDNTYPAIDVLTYNPSGTDRGGYYNLISGNIIADDGSSQRWSTPVRIQKSGGGGSTNVSTTLVSGNKIACLGGELFFTYGTSGASPIVHANSVIGVGASLPWVDMASTGTVDAAYSSGIVTNSGAVGAVTATLPDLSGANYGNGLEFTFIRKAAQNFTIAAGSGDTLYSRSGNSGSIVLTATTDQIVRVVSHGTSWFSDTVDYTT